MTQRVIEITSESFLTEPMLESVEDITSFFGNDHPLCLEIGCGIGDFITQLAARQPDRNYLAIDIYNKGCYKTCKKVDQAGLKNVRVMRAEARYLLANFMPKESLEAIYINCPDPWPKKRHRSRRLLSEAFLHMALLYLRPGGELNFATDFQDYAEDVAATIAAMDGYTNCQTEPLSTVRPDYPVSKYMRRFLEQGLPIYFVHYRKRHDYAINDQDVRLVQGFRLNWEQAQNG